jgi:SAM-dependent methyltransferase
MSVYDQYHKRQYEQPYRSTVSLINFIMKHITSNKIYRCLDVGCGAGANIFHISKKIPFFRFEGLDIREDLIEFAKKMQPEINFHCADFLTFNVSEQYDIIIAIQFISSVPFDLRDFIIKANELAKEYIILTGLFSEGWLEQHTIAYDLKENWEGIYKIYSLERLKEIVTHVIPNSSIIIEPFNIDIELPKKSNRFGTYTVKVQDGNLLQISGYMLMPWYNILIKKKVGII